MSQKVVFRPEARKDLLEAFPWYQSKQNELGHAFRDSVDIIVSSLMLMPERYPIVYLNVRRAFIRRFPFGIFYIVEGNAVIILAVMHARRDPKNWKKRI